MLKPRQKKTHLQQLFASHSLHSFTREYISQSEIATGAYILFHHLSQQLIPAFITSNLRGCHFLPCDLSASFNAGTILRGLGREGGGRPRRTNCFLHRGYPSGGRRAGIPAVQTASFPAVIDGNSPSKELHSAREIGALITQLGDNETGEGPEPPGSNETEAVRKLTASQV